MKTNLKNTSLWILTLIAFAITLPTMTSCSKEKQGGGDPESGAVRSPEEAVTAFFTLMTAEGDATDADVEAFVNLYSPKRRVELEKMLKENDMTVMDSLNRLRRGFGENVKNITIEIRENTELATEERAHVDVFTTEVTDENTIVEKIPFYVFKEEGGECYVEPFWQVNGPFDRMERVSSTPNQ